MPLELGALEHAKEGQYACSVMGISGYGGNRGQHLAPALRSTAAPGLPVGWGTGYRPCRAALSGVAAVDPLLAQPRPNPSVKRTSNGGLGFLVLHSAVPPLAAAYLKR